MNHTSPWRLFMGLLFLFASLSVQAQSGPPESQMFAVWEITTSPAEVSVLIKSWKNVIVKMKEHQVPMTMQCFTTDDNRFLLVSPIDNMAQLDKDPLQKMGEAIGPEGMKEIFMPMYENAGNLKNYIVRMPANLSYMPDSEENPNADAPYRMWTYMKFKPEAGMMIADFAKEAQAIYQKHNAPIGYWFFRDEMGLDAPLVVLQNWAGSRADLYENWQAEMPEAFRKEMGAFQQKIGKHLESVNTVMAYHHQDLIYDGSVEMAKKDE